MIINLTNFKGQTIASQWTKILILMEFGVAFRMAILVITPATIEAVSVVDKILMMIILIGMSLLGLMLDPLAPASPVKRQLSASQ